MSWCIKRTKHNAIMVNTWFNENVFKPKKFNEQNKPIDTGLSEDGEIYLHYPAFKSSYMYSSPQAGYIILDEFSENKADNHGR